MNAEELMIGDWVCYRGTNIQVTSLYDRNKSNEIGWGENESTWVRGWCIEPIPITQQILENNGFKLVDGHTSHWKIDGNGYDDIQISGVPDPKHHAVLTLNAHKTSHTGYGHGFYRFICDMDIQYVHELQHIMRICNIGKEIRL